MSSLAGLRVGGRETPVEAGSEVALSTLEERPARTCVGGDLVVIDETGLLVRSLT